MPAEPYDPSNDDSWDLQEGGELIDHYEWLISEGSFGFNDKWSNGTVPLLILAGATDNEAVPYVTNFYPLPKGWELVDGMPIADNPDKNKTFRKNSGIGAFIAAAVDAGAGEKLRSRGPATDPTVWVGMKFLMERRKYNEGTDYETTRPVPAKFLGVEGDAGVAVAPVPAPSAPSAGAANGVATIPKALEIKLKKAAKDAANHDAFIEYAFANIDGVDGNTEVEALVLDQAQFEAWKG